MHEISLVRNIFKTLEDEFNHSFHDIRDIYLQVGLLSNVQPLLIQSAFKAVIETEPHYNHTRLHVEVLPIMIYCPSCDIQTEVHNYKFVCSCGKPSNKIIQGEELLINKVIFND